MNSFEQISEDAAKIIATWPEWKQRTLMVQNKAKCKEREPVKQTDTNTLVRALRILVCDIHCEDGVATSVIREAADRIEQFDSEYRKAVQVVRKTNEDRDEIWSREKHLLDSLHLMFEIINTEKATDPPPPGWRVVETIRDFIVKTIETYQAEIRAAIERDKSQPIRSAG